LLRLVIIKNKKAFTEISGKTIYHCEYKNCRKFVEKGYVVCKKHIGQNKRDFLKNHIFIGNTVYKCDKQTAHIFNK